MTTRPRILIAECMQEISSFNPLAGDYDNFYIERGDAMLAQDGLNTSLGGALAVFRETGMAPVLTISARSGSAGILMAKAWQRLAGEVLGSIAVEAGSGIGGV